MAQVVEYLYQIGFQRFEMEKRADFIKKNLHKLYDKLLDNIKHLNLRIGLKRAYENTPGGKLAKEQIETEIISFYADLKRLMDEGVEPISSHAKKVYSSMDTFKKIYMSLDMDTAKRRFRSLVVKPFNEVLHDLEDEIQDIDRMKKSLNEII